MILRRNRDSGGGMGLWESGDSRDVSYTVEGQILNLEVYVYGGLQLLALQWPRLCAPGVYYTGCQVLRFLLPTRSLEVEQMP